MSPTTQRALSDAENIGTKVAQAGIDNDRCDGRFRPEIFGNLKSRHDVGARRGSSKYRFFSRKTPSHFFGLVSCDSQDLFDFVWLPERRNESDTDSFDLV